MTKPVILFVTGASGSGKTTAVRAVEHRALPDVSCYYFDTIGVPSIEEMRREYGSPEEWQAVTVERWFKRLATDTDHAGICILEGQVRPSFVFSAARRTGFGLVRVVLLDCEHDIRHARLKGPRGQPELINPRMDCWTAYLRGQADALELPVIDTTEIGIESVADKLIACVEAIKRQIVRQT